ncbi:MAG TPA: nitroreductase family protein [Candidatus Krumholzibacterium sp.]|nr:nitroreductase family protein [Candidatus Krumholzibacterium sp.]
MVDLEDILAKRRSIRRYTDEKVSYDTIVEIIDDATHAPSSGNEQPWRFIIVDDQSLMKRISDDCKKSLLERIRKDPEDYVKKYQKMLENEAFNIFYNAPAVVFIVGDRSLKNSEKNCALAAGYFMISAVARGLGTCWINFAVYITSKELLDKLGITEKDMIVAPIIIGYPEHIPDMPERKKPDVTRIG